MHALGGLGRAPAVPSSSAAEKKPPEMPYRVHYRFGQLSSSQLRALRFLKASTWYFCLYVSKRNLPILLYFCILDAAFFELSSRHM